MMGGGTQETKLEPSPPPRCTATADWVDAGLLLKQHGKVTPFRGGIRKLKAHTELIVSADGTALADFLRGQEVETCSF